jgi:hypothetical protein
LRRPAVEGIFDDARGDVKSVLGGAVRNGLGKMAGITPAARVVYRGLGQSPGK